MILAIDIGNTNIVVGCIDDQKTYFIERLATVRTKTELEYAVDLKTLLEIYHIKKADIEGCIISSVVPQITNIAKLAAEKILKKEVMVLGPGVKTGLNIMMDNPGQLGADLVADAVAGLNEYPVPFIVIDMGTATTVSVVNSKKQYIGGMILPGIGISLDALTARASQLSGISIDAPKHVIGRNTIECMKSGVLYSNAAAIDGIIDRVEEELGEKTTVIATGGLAKKIISHCIISSVVPQITNIAKLAAEKILKKEVMVLGPGVKTGLNIMMDNPGQLGADLVADAVAGLNEYPVPFIVIDMGTATTVSVVNSKKQYIGGMILPGIGISLDALTARASQLSGISIDAPKHVIGRNTIECMKSGVLYSNAAAIDGIIDRVEEELGEKTTVIATGGLAKKIISHCKKEIILDEDLLLKGLLVIYKKNK